MGRRRARTARSNDEMFREYVEHPTPELLAEIIEANRGLVGSEINRVSWHPDVEDLNQVAMIALMRAVQGFDPDLGFTFATYAVRAIKNAIRNYSERVASSVSMPMRPAHDRNEFLLGEQFLRGELGREPTRAETLEHLGWDRHRIALYDRAAAAGNVLSMDVTTDDFDAPLGDFVADPTAEQIFDENLAVEELLADLPPRERELWVKRFIEGYSNVELARDHGVSNTTIGNWMRATRERVVRNANGVEHSR
ncbi:MAG: sigma-70 family RNA polymerase sigma factor [Acidimicrobiia bacterium]